MRQPIQVVKVYLPRSQVRLAGSCAVLYILGPTLRQPIEVLKVYLPKSQVRLIGSCAVLFPLLTEEAAARRDRGRMIFKEGQCTGFPRPRVAVGLWIALGR